MEIRKERKKERKKVFEKKNEWRKARILELMKKKKKNDKIWNMQDTKKEI